MRQKSSRINNRFVGWISKADCELLVKDEKVRYLLKQTFDVKKPEFDSCKVITELLLDFI